MAALRLANNELSVNERAPVMELQRTVPASSLSHCQSQLLLWNDRWCLCSIPEAPDQEENGARGGE